MVDKQLAEKLDQLQPSMDVSILRDKTAGYGARQRELLLEVLSNSDEAFQALMRGNLETFTDFFDTHGAASGMKWDDLVVRFEWRLDILELQSSLESEPRLHSVVRQASETLKYSFNGATFEAWRRSCDL